MSYSGWNVWLHPRRTAKELSEALAQNAELSESLAIIEKETARLADELADRQKKLEDSEARLYKLALEQTSIDRRNNELSKTVEMQSKEIARLSADLKSREDAESMIAGFEKMLSGVESMKANYEKRIERLKSQIKDMKKSAESRDRADSELSIDMDPDSLSSQIRKRLRPDIDRRHHREEDTNWLEELPD